MSHCKFIIFVPIQYSNVNVWKREYILVHIYLAVAKICSVAVWSVDIERIASVSTNTGKVSALRSCHLSQSYLIGDTSFHIFS